MQRFPLPLLSFNNEVRHQGRVFHIQTEDFGVGHPHIVTHLVAEDGRIVRSASTDYSEHLGRPDLVSVIRRLMKDQHKAMFVALRDGSRDTELGQLPSDPISQSYAPTKDLDLEHSAAREEAANFTAPLNGPSPEALRFVSDEVQPALRQRPPSDDLYRLVPRFSPGDVTNELEDITGQRGNRK
jgi:hypothetical protein